LQQFIPATKLWLALGMLSLLTAVGCGYGGSVTLSHQTGTFSNANLKGSYVYEIQGTSLATNTPYREAGVFTADGAGHITAGLDDFEGAVISGESSSVTGTYTVANDGTGFIAIGPTELGNISSSSKITFAITLASSLKLEVIEADNFADGAGVAELQDSTAAAATPSGTFVFRLHQDVSAQNQGPASQVGVMTVSGGAGTGAMDQNLGGTFSSPNLTLTFSAPSSLGNGTGSFTDSITNFRTDFLYFIVNSGKLHLLVTSANATGSGTAEAQTGAVSGGLSGSYAFGSRGDDSNFFDGVATVGQFTANAGSISGIEDAMKDGALSSSVSLAECSSTASNGRVVVTNCSSTTPLQVFWMVTPARAVFLDNSASTIEDGTADLQTTSSFSLSTMNGQFAVVMGGIDVRPELLSRVGTLQFNGAGKLTLNEEVNLVNSFSGGASSPGLLSGTYGVSSNGRITANVNNGSLDLVLYAVSGSQAYVLQSDSGFITSGTLELQH
jgi:hypothetical protein